jgi:ABC-type maltose transport system permease subunit
VCVCVCVCVYAMSRMAFLGRFSSIVTIIRSCPGALCVLNRFIAIFISTGVEALSGGDSWQTF